LPLPELPEVTVSHVVLLLDAVHPQPPGAVTVTEPLPTPAPGAALEAPRLYVQVAPACVTVKLCPAMVNVPVREVLFGLAVTA
jgi:hypothetical protein